ncbi:hypothetical protein CspeluHIS016_0300250 [Cutaneotrichosporon spelunceum]|uniref:Ribosome biogenesis protein SLX9 n=1 Tax=Cutaneotrichosporon spelunceum TaxID=1672016 RepID=A0AAD3TTJ4_9TREE|nr:hypothetical protein CspeluHIS016_0300250 [Cutaneotrichosporon spelunceum]
MPRAVKTSSRRHESAVALPKRAFAAPAAAETVLPGSNPFATIAESGPSPAPKTAKEPVFYGAIAAGAAAHPYSRSHLRREKRKAKAAVALGGGLGSVALALGEVAGDEAPKEETKAKSRKEVMEDAARRRDEEARRRAEEGKIGQGRGHGLKEKARRKQISTNAQRIPAVMAHPAFKANPWATIREHAANSLAEAQAVKDVADRKKATAAQLERDKVRLPASMQGMEVE